MMKVNETSGHIQGPPVRKNRPGGGGDGTFQEIMDQVSRQGSTAPGSPSLPASVPVFDGVQILPGAGGVDASPATAARERVLQEIRDTLDVVDRYAAHLGNPSLSASDLRPLAEHLEGRLGGLRRMEADSELPGTLRSVVSDLAVTISAEMAKFGRGDYE